MGPIGKLPVEWLDYNLYNSIMSPSTTHCSNTELTHFLERYLLQKAMSVFKFELPKSVDKKYFLFCLFVNGWIILTKDEVFGEVAYYAALEGCNMYRHPKKATLTFTDTNPGLDHNKVVNIDPLDENRTGEMMKLQMFGGFMDLVSFYAERMALCFEAMDMNLINSHLAYIMGTDSKSLAETFKSVYDDIASGIPAAVTDKDMFDEDGKPKWITFFNNLKQNFIAPDLMLLLNQIERDFCEKIGIPTANTDKRERLTDDEVNSNNVATLTFIEECLESMQESFEFVTSKGIWSVGSVELRVPDLDDINSAAEEGGKINGEF